MAKLVLFLIGCMLTGLFSNSVYGMNIFEAAKTGNGARIKELIATEPQRDIYNCKNAFGWTPLHMAACYGQSEAVKILIDSYDSSELGLGIQEYVNSAGDNDETPLHAAAGNGNWKIVQTLIDNGAFVDSKTDNSALSEDIWGDTALHRAAYCGHENAVNALLAAGASIDSQNKKGMTPLLNAVRGKHPGIVKILLNANARIDLKARIGHIEDQRTLVLTPLEYAQRNVYKENGYKEIVQLFENHLARKEIRTLLQATHTRLRTGIVPAMKELPIWIYQDIFNLLKKVNR